MNQFLLGKSIPQIASSRKDTPLLPPCVFLPSLNAIYLSSCVLEVVSKHLESSNAHLTIESAGKS